MFEAFWSHLCYPKSSPLYYYFSFSYFKHNPEDYYYEVIMCMGTCRSSYTLLTHTLLLRAEQSTTLPVSLPPPPPVTAAEIVLILQAPTYDMGTQSLLLTNHCTAGARNWCGQIPSLKVSSLSWEDSTSASTSSKALANTWTLQDWITYGLRQVYMQSTPLRPSWMARHTTVLSEDTILHMKFKS